MDIWKTTHGIEFKPGIVRGLHRGWGWGEAD